MINIINVSKTPFLLAILSVSVWFIQPLSAEAVVTPLTCSRQPYGTIIVDGSVLTNSGTPALLRQALATATSSVNLCGGWYDLKPIRGGHIFAIEQDNITLKGFPTPHPDVDGVAYPMLNIDDYSISPNNSSIISGDNVTVKNMRFQLGDTLHITGKNVRWEEVIVYGSAAWFDPVVELQSGSSLYCQQCEISESEREDDYVMVQINDASAAFYDSWLESGDLALTTGATCQTLNLDTVWMNSTASVFVDDTEMINGTGTDVTYSFATDAC